MLDNLFKKNFKIVISIILIFGILIPLLGIYLSTNCELNNTEECLIETEKIMPDFYWHSNIIKYVSTYKTIPLEVESTKDGGPAGDIITGIGKGTFHGSAYYYLAAIIYNLSNSFLALHIFSVIIMLLTNILFLFFLKEISRKWDKRYSFIVFSMILFVFLPTQLFTSLMIHPSVIYPPLLILSLLLYIRALNKPILNNFIFLGISMGVLTLTELKGFVLPLTLSFYALVYLIKKGYKKFKLLLLSLIITAIIGSYTFIRNYLQFGNPFGFWKTSQGQFYTHEFSKLLSYFTAFWAGIYGGNESIKPILSIFVLALTLITIYSIIKNKFGIYKKIDILVSMSIITIILAFFMTCSIEYLLTSFTCVGDIVHGRYLLIFNPTIAIFSSLVFIKFKNLLSLLFILIISILFSIDFLWALI